MRRRLIGLSGTGKLVLKAPDGKDFPIETGPQSVVCLAIDCSASMSGNKLSQARLGAIDFSREALEKGYAVGVIMFDNLSRVVCAPCRDLRSIQSGVQKLRAQGSTNMAHALTLAVSNLSAVGRRIIVLVTDGHPDNRETALTAAAIAKKSGIRIMTIGTEDADHDFLRLLTGDNGSSLEVGSSQLSLGIASAARLLPPPGNG